MWRALAVFRLASLGYALVWILRFDHTYPHRTAAWLVGAVLTGWTVAALSLYGRGRVHGARLWTALAGDVIVLPGCLLATLAVRGGAPLGSGHALPGVAVAAAVIAWAIALGRVGGVVAAFLVGAADLITRGGITQNSVNNVILLLLTAIAVGHVAALGRSAEEQLDRAARREAAAGERDRLARDIHDSVLQVLALVARRAGALGGEAAELGRLAGEQEAALRRLVHGGPRDGAGPADLGRSLDGFASARVTVSAPATPVELPERTHDEIVAAVAGALDNVARHAGPRAHAWVLLEDDPEAVTVTVRDDGAGFGPDRLAEAAASGRLGVAQSITGRIRDLGGRAEIWSGPGRGTEVELWVPREGVRP
jgi:signal transduction histidine kinase